MGRWEIEAQNNDSWPDIPIWAARDIGGGTLQNECVATVWASDKTEATARLIASSPAMYRALKCFVEAVDIIVDAEGAVTEDRRQVYVSIQNSETHKQAKAILNSITGGK